MGAITIDIKVRAYDIHEAFKIACEEAREDYGIDTYNGRINNCDFVGDLTRKFKDEGDKKTVSYALDCSNKGEVYGWEVSEPVKNSNKVQSKLINKPTSVGRIWKTVYTARQRFDDVVYAETYTKQECIKKARALVEEHNDLDLEIRVEKKLVQGSNVCANIIYKRSRTQRPGEFRFMGLAPY